MCFLSKGIELLEVPGSTMEAHQLHFSSFICNVNNRYRYYLFIPHLSSIVQRCNHTQQLDIPLIYLDYFSCSRNKRQLHRSSTMKPLIWINWRDWGRETKAIRKNDFWKLRNWWLIYRSHLSMLELLKHL